MTIKKSSWDTLSDCSVGRPSTSRARDNILWKMDTNLEGTRTPTWRRRQLRLTWGGGVVHAWVALTNDPGAALNQPDVLVSLSGRFFASRRLPDGGIQPLEKIPAKPRRARQHIAATRRRLALPAHLT